MRKLFKNTGQRHLFLSNQENFFHFSTSPLLIFNNYDQSNSTFNQARAAVSRVSFTLRGTPGTVCVSSWYFCCTFLPNLGESQKKGLPSERGAQARVVSRAGLFGSGSGPKLTKISGLIRAWDVLFVLGAQKYNQNNLATLLNFSDLT